MNINANNFDHPAIIQLYTLFDISNTNILRNVKGCEDTKLINSRNKQRNWETILQLLSLRTQPIILNGPECFETNNLAIYGLSSNFNGKQSVWYVEFSSESSEVYGNDPITLLNFECDFVPMIAGLDETTKFPQECIITRGEYKNTSFVITPNPKLYT